MGVFLTFEGLDGCGKSTQVERVAAWLRGRRIEVVTTREPGGTALGEELRGLLLGVSPHAALAPSTELALMCASRAQSVVEVIRPALDRGAWVLCDRFHDATEAYQGGGRGLDRDGIRDLHRVLCGNLQPRLTLILDLETEVCLRRARTRIARQESGGGAGEGRFEREAAGFFDRTAAVYRDIAAREPERCRLVDARGTPAEVEQRLRTVIEPLLAPHSESAAPETSAGSRGGAGCR